MSALLDQLDADMSVFMDSDQGFAGELFVNGYKFDAIFDRAYVDISSGGVQTEGYRPVLICATSDVANFNHDDLVTGLPESYRIVNPQPDGTGETIITLELIA